jgi:hypothetical protein
MKRLPLFWAFMVATAMMVGIVVWWWEKSEPTPKSIIIETFEECEAAGYPILDSYPQQCQTPDGRTFTRVTPEVTASPITLTGTYDCLPKKVTGGPVTLECAFGLQTETGYYALDLSAIPTERYPSFQSGETIRVEGSLIPLEMVSQDQWMTYEVAGVVAVKSISL